MAIFRRKVQPPESTQPPPKAVLAAAVPLTGPEAVRGIAMKQTAEGWQNDAWYFFDAVGELASAVTWIANAVSKADLFGAEVDPETGLITGPTDNAAAQAAAATALGGAGKRAQLQHIMAVCWQVPGEAFVIIRGRPAVNGVAQQDEWLVLSGQKVKAKSKAWTYQDPASLEWIQLGAADRMIRVWSPHPNDQSKANTAVRSALPVLREIEKASMNLSATLDSRLATAGIHAIPAEMDFPTPEGADPMTASEMVSDMYLRAASAGLSNPGTAASQVPIIFPVPAEYIDPFVQGRMYPETAMDNTVITLRDADIIRLHSALDMPNETAAGSTGGMNHWGAWQVEETTYKIFIEPLLDRVGDALTEFWYRPVLKAMGVTDPERYTLAWDTTGIVARPDATEDLNWMFDQGLISEEYRRQQSGIPDDAIPSEDETQLRRLERIVMGAPTLAADPQISEALFGFAIAPAAAGVDPEAAGAEAGDALEAPEQPAALPPGPPVDSDGQELPEGLVAAASLVVKDALSRAGGRLLTREYRGQFGNTPKHELYRAIPIGPDSTPARLMADSFQFADDVADGFGLDREGFQTRVREYTRALLITRTPYSAMAMEQALRSLK